MSEWTNGFSFNLEMKGIMCTTFFKVCLLLYFGTYFVSGEDNNETTTTSKPLDLSGSETGNHETSIPLLRPGESLSRSQSISFSKSTPLVYEHRNPAFEKDRYEERASEYRKDSRSQVFHKDNEGGGYHYQGSHEQVPHQQNEGYGQSNEGPYEQHNHGEEERSYGESPENVNAYHGQPEHDAKEQIRYGHLEYDKETSFEPGKEQDSYNGGEAPYLRYNYEVSSNKQKGGYENLEAPVNSGKSGYGPAEPNVYQSQELEYYPKPVPTSYIPQDIHKEENYRSGEQKEGNYFHAVPKEAGYAPNDQNEPEYLQSPPKEPSYFKQAGYFPRSHEPAAYLPPLPKEKPTGSLDNRKVAVFIKHIGHKTPGTNQHVNKESRGYLLLPVVSRKIHEKLKEMGAHLEGGEYKQAYKTEPGSYTNEPTSYHNEPPSYHGKSRVVEKEVYIRPKIIVQPKVIVEPKVVKYPVDAKVTGVHFAPSYNQDHEGYAKPQAKIVVSHGNYRSSKPIIRQQPYEDARYESPKARSYPSKETSDEGEVQYIAKPVSDYEPEAKSYSTGSLGYGGVPSLIPSYIHTLKYEPAPVYRKVQEYSSPYEVKSHKSASIQITGRRPSPYVSLSRGSDYSGESDISSLTHRGTKKNSGVSHSYSPRYKEIFDRVVYESPKLDITHKDEKSHSYLLPKSKDSETYVFRPSAHSSKGRVSAKTLVENFGLHDYESLLSKPKHGFGTGSLYYDLHTFPLTSHTYSQFGFRKSGRKYHS